MKSVYSLVNGKGLQMIYEKCIQFNIFTYFYGNVFPYIYQYTRNLLVDIMTHYLYKILILCIYDNTE